VDTDRRALSQVLINLVNNAIKFTDKGLVTVENIQRQVNGHRRVEFSVVDTGIGIKPEGQAKLFQAFEQVDPGHRSEGTGLGLHLSQKLAALLGGHIEFQSEFGKGSRFALILPLK
jgi:protein-histidine pros-kinase